MTFFKNDTPEQIASLRERVAALEATMQRIDNEASEMEQDLRARITELEKLVRSGSLPKEPEKDEQAVIPGYVPWSQRKQNRIREHRDGNLPMRIANRGRKPASGSTEGGASGA